MSKALIIILLFVFSNKAYCQERDFIWDNLFIANSEKKLNRTLVDLYRYEITIGPKNKNFSDRIVQLKNRRPAIYIKYIDIKCTILLNKLYTLKKENTLISKNEVLKKCDEFNQIKHQIIDLTLEKIRDFKHLINIQNESNLITDLEKTQFHKSCIIFPKP